VAKAHGHTTLLGGLHVSLVKKQVMANPEVDYAIVGDGEIAMHQLLQALDGERAFAEVSGLLYRDPEGEVRENPNTTEILDLDTLPVPDYRLAGVGKMNLYPVVTSRDCPFKCNYCTVGTLSHGRYRARAPAAIVEEILLAKERYGIRSLIVVDENFAYRVDRAMEFCELLIEKKVGLPWTAFEGIRADCLNDELLTALKASDCRWLFFGIETVENAVLKEVRKGGKFHHVERAIALARKYGFKVGGFLIIGLPGSTFEKDMQSLHWAMAHLDKCTFWTVIPYQGTAMYDWVLRHGRLLREPIGANLINTLSTMPFFETDDYPAGERKRAHAIANLRIGAHLFLETMDGETARKLPRRKRTAAHHRRRLVEMAVRYDPSLLGQLVGNRSFPPVADPVEDALRAQRSDEPSLLTGDLMGSLGTPIDRPPNPEEHKV